MHKPYSHSFSSLPKVLSPVFLPIAMRWFCMGWAQLDGDTDDNQGIRSQIPSQEAIFLFKKGEGIKPSWRQRRDRAVTRSDSLWEGGARWYKALSKPGGMAQPMELTLQRNYGVLLKWNILQGFLNWINTFWEKKWPGMPFLQSCNMLWFCPFISAFSKDIKDITHVPE